MPHSFQDVGDNFAGAFVYIEWTRQTCTPSLRATDLSQISYNLLEHTMLPQRMYLQYSNESSSSPPSILWREKHHADPLTSQMGSKLLLGPSASYIGQHSSPCSGHSTPCIHSHDTRIACPTPSFTPVRRPLTRVHTPSRNQKHLKRLTAGKSKTPSAARPTGTHHSTKQPPNVLLVWYSFSLCFAPSNMPKTDLFTRWRFTISSSGSFVSTAGP